MSANNEDDREFHKSVPLDLARSQITTVKTVEGKAPLMMSTQTLRGMRVLAQGISSSGSQSGQTIITTNIVPQVLKQEPLRTQITNIINTSSQSLGQSQITSGITIQRPSQVSLTATTLSQSIPSGTTYHVPRGPAVVANIAAPRGNVASVRTPMILTAPSGSQAHSYARPPRAPSPAQGTAWLNTSSSNGSQIKGAPTVLSSPVRGATVTGKPALLNRAQPSAQTVQTLRPATILHSAITIGQPGQIHSFKSSQGQTGLQNLNNTMNLPPRTQTILYNTNTTNQLFPTRITVAATSQNPKSALRPAYVSSGKVTVAASHLNSNRLISPQGTVLTQTARISALPLQQAQNHLTLGNTATKIPSSQQVGAVNKLTGPLNATQNTTGNNMGSARILHSIVAVANSQAKSIEASGTKIITQSTPVNVPSAVLTQRPTPSPQSVPIVKPFPSENSQNSSVFIHTPINSSAQHCATSSPTSSAQTNTLVPTTSVAVCTLGGGTFFYDSSGTYSVTRSFCQQSSDSVVTQASQPRSSAMGTPVHSMVTSQQSMRYNSLMVVEPSQNQQQYNPDFNQDQTAQQIPLLNRTVASPRPSILRKRDYDGNSVKVSKNLNHVLTTLPSQLQANQLPLSPPPRPDSRENGNSSGGSTTVSATSSPGLAEDDNSVPALSDSAKEHNKPIIEMSPRKKPRKQQLTGNDLNEQNDDMQFISDNAVKTEEYSDVHSDSIKDGAPEAHCITTVRKPASASLLNTYKQTWKSTHNHFMRYSDVKPKEERKPSIIDLANQFRIQDKINGWKVYHLSTQMDDLAELEEFDYENLSDFLKCMEDDGSNKCEKDINRISELIKGNLQRIKIIKEGILEAKSQMMKVFEHKSQVTDLINRCASKRNFKKREKI